jgi:hypothetical protein
MKTKSLVQISPGNTKTGRMAAVSLTPIAGCPKGVPCGKCQIVNGEKKNPPCYANKCTQYSPQAKLAWARNLRLARRNQSAFFQGVASFVEKKSPEYFRYHVGGDILDQSYLEHMKDLAIDFPATKFLAFTKNHSLDFSNLPDNLSIVFSMWSGWGNTRKKMARAWMLDESNLDKRIPKDAIECPGNCETCGVCWSLGKKGLDVVFHKH